MEIRLSDHFTYKRLIRFVLPTIVMMVVTSVYSIVDGFFVSNFVGKNPFAALNLIYPVLMALGSFGFMIGTGGSALIAVTLGMGQKEKANQYFTMFIYVIIVVGTVLSILGFIFMRPIAIAIGASDVILEDCVLYGRILIVANTFFMLQNSFQSFLVAAEKPYIGLAISCIAGINNIIFDFLFVYILHMGITGAALATVMSQVIGGLIPLLYFLRPNTSLLRLTKTKLYLSALWKGCANGSSEMLTNLSTSFVGMLYNLQLIKVAAENGVAAYGVIMYVNFIFMGFFFGYAIGCGPLVGYHYGAGNKKELTSLFQKSLIITGSAAVIMTAAAEILALPLSKIFVGYDPELLALTCRGFQLYSLSFLTCGFNIFGSAFFTALNNGAVSAIISFLRTLVIQIAAILILPLFLGIDGIWLAIAVAEGVTLVITVMLWIVYRKRYGY